MKSAAIANVQQNVTLKVLRYLLIVVGMGAMAFAIFADSMGYGDAGSFGIGQYLLILIGLIILLIGFFGAKFFDIYKSTAVIILNTILLLALLELGAIILGRISFRSEQAEIEQLPYYANQEWSNVYWEEAKRALGVRYQPYTIWRHAPFQGETVNFSEYGVRQTPGANCQANTPKIFAFGGSTMLGWGSPDWETIPAYLQEGFEVQFGGSACVINFGEDGYVSTQSLVALMLQLQSGNIPEVVVFYDGVNEVIAAYESGQPSVHVTLPDIASKFDAQENPVLDLAKTTRTYGLLRSWMDAVQQKNMAGTADRWIHRGTTIDSRDLADKMTEVYLKNQKIVGALAKEYGFDYFFILQPHPAVGSKPLTNEEKAIVSRIDPALASIAAAFYENIGSLDRDYEQITYLGNMFDEKELQIWIDDVGHITPEGNRQVAQEILAIIEDHFANK